MAISLLESCDLSSVKGENKPSDAIDAKERDKSVVEDVEVECVVKSNEELKELSVEQVTSEFD